MKKSKLVALSAVFLLAISCVQEQKKQDIKYNPKTMETKKDNNGNELVYYMGMWYLLNRTNGSFNTGNGHYTPTSNGGFTYTKPVVSPSYSSSSKSTTVSRGGFGSTGRSFSVGS